MLLIGEAYDHDEDSRISELRTRSCPLALFRAGVVNTIQASGEQSCSCEDHQIIAWAVLPRQQGLLLDISETRYLASRTHISQRPDWFCRLGSGQKLHSGRIYWPSLQIIHANNALIFVIFLHEPHHDWRKSHNICDFRLLWRAIYIKVQACCEMLVR